MYYTAIIAFSGAFLLLPGRKSIILRQLADPTQILNTAAFTDALQVKETRKCFHPGRITVVQIFFFLSLVIFLPSFSCPQSLNSLIQSGQNYLMKGQFVEALEQLNFAILKEPASSELYFLRGYAKYSLDDFIGSEEDYNKSIGLSPFKAEVFVNRAVVRCERLNYNGAFEDLASAHRLDSANADVYFNLGRIKLILKKYYASLGDCNTAIRLGYKHESIYLLKGSSEWGLKRYDEAIADFKKAVEINPANPWPFIQLGSLWLEQNKVDSSIRYYDRAILVDSNNVYALFNRSLARAKVPDPEGALNDLNKVIRLSPYNSYAYFNRAILYIDKNEKLRAILDLTKVIRLNPKNIVSYYYRGMLKTDTKDYSGALEDLNKTVELSPDYADAYYARFQVRNKLKDYTGARKDYKQAFELGKKNHFNPDSLSTEKKDYLQSLVKLSGDFEEMNTMNGKFQNQPVSIELMPLFRFFPDKAPFGFLRLYDSYPKAHYHGNITRLTIHDELFTDSLCTLQIRLLSQVIDSTSGEADTFLKRATYFAARNQYNEAFRDLNSSLKLDSGNVLTYFTRANARYSLIRLIISLDSAQSQAMVGRNLPENTVQAGNTYQIYDSVIADYSAAVRLDPGFGFGYYNRGIVYCRTHNFRDAEEDFSKAIVCIENFAEAYYNRGLVRILRNENLQGCEDLSRAGELGIPDAYRVIKRYCYR
jgi:tetratricopeptide (TPR) repeat protein